MERTIKKTLIDWIGAAPWPWAARRIATPAMRFVAIAAPLSALALLLVAILPPVDSGGKGDRLVASALADSDTARGNGGGDPGATGADHGDDGGGAGGNNGNAGGNHGGGNNGNAGGNHGGGNNGNGNGNNGNGNGNAGGNNGRGNIGGGPGATGSDNGDDGAGGNTTSNGGGKDSNHGGGGGTETGGGERSGDPTGSELADEEIEAQLAGGAPAIAAQPALAAFRATVLSADQEAAAIAAGWGDTTN